MNKNLRLETFGDHISGWDDRFFLTEAPLIQRLALAFDFESGYGSLQSTMDFGFSNVIDFMSPHSMTLWRHSPSVEWSLLGSAGKDFPLPPDSVSWAAINQESLLTGRPSISDSTHVGIENKAVYHWAIPVLIPGQSCYVMHILAEDRSYPDSVLESFLRSFAHLLVSSDRSTGIDNPPVENTNDHLHEPLTQRQEKILELLAQDLTYGQIALRLGFSQSTVKQDAMKIFVKLGVSNRDDAVLKIR